MPCRDGREDWDTEHNLKAVELLCGLLRTFAPTDAEWTPELRQWWADHQNYDAYIERRSRGA